MIYSLYCYMFGVFMKIDLFLIKKAISAKLTKEKNKKNISSQFDKLQQYL